MANTEPHNDAAAIVPLRDADLTFALALSASAQWNQNAADWRSLLRLGRGWGIHAAGADGIDTLAASTIVLPYGADFAWVSMVLVLPQFQRRGYAGTLLRHAIAALRNDGRAAVLDATPAGHAVYEQAGFRDTFGFSRWRRQARSGVNGHAAIATTRPLVESDWPAIEALDAPAFGASRIALLRELARRLPQAARVLEEAGRLRGFVLGRDGAHAHQIGPLVADDSAVAIQLLEAALKAIEGPVYVDLLDHRDALQTWLERQGFAFQRPFVRMVHGRIDAPGWPELIWLVAGPELG
ncbi:MAG: GNAT family N-acetyltransferase [Burkholderiaceae bacterium]